MQHTDLPACGMGAPERLERVIRCWVLCLVMLPWQSLLLLLPQTDESSCACDVQPRWNWHSYLHPLPQTLPPCCSRPAAELACLSQHRQHVDTILHQQTSRSTLTPLLGQDRACLTSPSTQYRSSGRQFLKTQPTASKYWRKIVGQPSVEDPIPPGASHRVTSEPLKKEKPYHRSQRHEALHSRLAVLVLYRLCNNRCYTTLESHSANDTKWMSSFLKAHQHNTGYTVTRQENYMWKYDALVFAVFYIGYQRHCYKCV